METTAAMTDAELLRAWSARRCQQSFRALVEKYLGLVQGVALRRTGDAALAGEVAQSVFTRLAAKAARITVRPTLAPWLHHCAWCESTSALRRESTRSRHMKAYAEHLRTAGAAGAPSALGDALPYLDAALNALPGDDRRIVLMRFVEGRGLRDIAAALGKTEAAVRKQAQRALEMMALRLRRQGVGLSSAALAAGLSAVLAPPARAAAVAAISSRATVTGAKLSLLDHLLTLMNTKTNTALITAGCMALPLFWQWREKSALEEQLADATRDSHSLRATNSLLRDRTMPTAFRAGVTAAAASSPGIAGGAGDWEAALKTPDPIQRLGRLAALMAVLTPESAPRVAEVFQRLRGEGSTYETEHRHFLRAWGRLDGAAALTSLKGADGNYRENPETLAALAGYAQSSPAAARAWLESLPAGDAATALALGVIDGWSLTDFDAASGYAATLPRSTARDQFRSLLLQRALAAGGVDGAQRWFGTIPGDEHNQLYKQRAFDELIAAMMTRDPSSAAAWVTHLGRQQFMDGDALPEIASALAASSPAEAVRWLGSLGPGEGEGAQRTAETWERVMDQWSRQDANAAGTWLQAQADHPAYAQMAATHSRRLASTDGTAAFAWARSISDESARSAARDDVARQIMASHGDDARNVLADAGYQPEQIEALESDTLRRHELLYAFNSDSGRLQIDQETTWEDARHLLSTLRGTEAQKIVEDSSQSAGIGFLDAADGANESAGHYRESNPQYQTAHPGGAPANCAQCHR